MKRGIEKGEAVFQIANLVVAMFAFSIMLSLGSGVVSGQVASTPVPSGTAPPLVPKDYKTLVTGIVPGEKFVQDTDGTYSRVLDGKFVSAGWKYDATKNTLTDGTITYTPAYYIENNQVSKIPQPIVEVQQLTTEISKIGSVAPGGQSSETASGTIVTKPDQAAAAASAADELKAAQAATAATQKQLTDLQTQLTAAQADYAKKVSDKAPAADIATALGKVTTLQDSVKKTADLLTVKKAQEAATKTALDSLTKQVQTPFAVGNEVSVTGTNTFFGTIEGVNPDGTYSIRDPNTNELKTVAAKDVKSIEPEKTKALGSWDLGFFWNGLINGFSEGLVAVGLIQTIGNLIPGAQPAQINALSLAAQAGFTVAGLFKGIMGAKHIAFGTWKEAASSKVVWQGWQPIIGIATALVVLYLLYQTKSKKTVSFECKPWEAPTGGADCEKCNSDIYPCTEYRCRSLGQSCVLLNVGTNEERCAWNASTDIIPPVISTWDDALTTKHKYNPDTAVSPPDNGVKIIYAEASDGCIKAFTPLSFGIKTNEPAQCKIDTNRTMNYTTMQYYFGGSNLYSYNHTQTLSLPGPANINKEAPELQSDGNYNLYVRCRDANGNENVGEFVFNFCVEKGPDVTPPVIEATSIANNMPFHYGLNQTSIEVYVNEPADCKWSRTDQSYDNMETTMTCSQSVSEMNNNLLYTCKTTLTGLEDRKDNVYYFKCRDQPVLGASPDRNTNTNSYVFTLKGTEPLSIISTSPNGTITSGTALAAVNLEVETDNGYNFGDSWCSYSNTGAENDWIEMFETGTNKHSQRLDLPGGDYTYYFRCVDLGGNADENNVSFSVKIDTEAPKIIRAYKDGVNLKIATDENSTCTYSTNTEKKCNFILGEATNMPYTNSSEHYAEWNNQVYYIKCMDSNGNQPLPTECSLIIMPSNF